MSALDEINTRYGSGLLEALAGPTIGAAATAVTMLVKAGNATAEGRILTWPLG